MKLQHLIIVFLIIMLPMALIMSQYTGLQIDTLATKTKYDTALLGATFDTMSAFELNTVNSDKSSVIGEEIRDLEAVISTFSTSLSSSMGLSGASNNYILSYVPAIVFGLYDGYYIYSQNDKGTGTELKPYVYYTKTYTNGNNINITIAYSLDNYVSIYGTYGNNQTISASGYLVVPTDIEVSQDFAHVRTKDEKGDVITKVINPGGQSKIKYKNYDINPEIIYNNEVKTGTYNLLTNQPKYTTDAMMYYYEAKQFTEIYNKVIEKLDTTDKEILKITAENDPENEESAFMNEKIKVMKDSITTNLNNAIYNYEGRTSETYEMPQLNGEDWAKILNNVSITAFLKGIPIGATTYNNYVVVNSTTNQKYNSAKAIDFIEYDNSSGMKSKGYYHKITCDELLGNINSNSEIIGYASVDFERYRYSRNNSNDYYYYYKHNEYADYDCEIETIENQNVYTMEEYIREKKINNRSLDRGVQEKILRSYYTAVGRIRYGLVKASSYINLDDIEKNFTVNYHLEGGRWQDNTSNVKSITSTVGRLQVISELPRNGSKIFVGWSSSRGAMESEAKVGDTIYASKEKTINLYAVWKNP